MLDGDFAELGQVETMRLNEQVKRNEERFPKDFIFQLSSEQWEDLKSQNATSSFWIDSSVVQFDSFLTRLVIRIPKTTIEFCNLTNSKYNPDHKKVFFLPLQRNFVAW